MNAPRLSIIVATVGDGSSLPGCLTAILEQAAPPSLEVIVPVDASVRDLGALRDAYPAVEFLEVEGTAENALSGDLVKGHLAIDRRRACAMAHAKGELIAIAEEHGRPTQDWAHSVSAAHAAHSNAVIGGAVTNVRARMVNWALFFMDAGRYQNPVPQDPVRYVTDVNVSYKRAALYRVESVWREMYMETDLHDALAEQGEQHLLRQDIVMGMDRGNVTLRYALAERFAWSRLYASRRSQGTGRWKRLALAIGSPILGPLLFLRQTRLAFSRGQHRGAFIRCIPVLLLFDLLWSIGELTGYLTGRAVSRKSSK